MIFLSQRVERSFLLAEKAIKRYEMWFGCTPTPAVQQLRYAGNHLARYIQAVEKGSDKDSTSVLLDQAINHCRRAWFDAFDGFMITILDVVRELQSKGWSLEAILKVYPDYEADQQVIIETVDFFRMNAFVVKMDVATVLKRLRLAKAFLPIYRKLTIANARLLSGYETLEQIRLNNQERRAIFNTAISFSTTLIGAMATLIVILSTESFSPILKATFVFAFILSFIGCWFFFWRGRTKSDLVKMTVENKRLIESLGFDGQ